MASSEPHTIKAFDEDLEHINALVAQLGGLAEAAIRDAAGGLLTGSHESTARVFAGDARMDELGAEIEALCARVIALRGPMADDLRAVLGAFKIAVLLHRIGECARDVAEHALEAHHALGEAQFRIVKEMTNGVSHAVTRALDAFVGQKAGICEEIWSGDRLIDDCHMRLLGQLMRLMEEKPKLVAPATALLMASLKLQRIGDHAVNVARVVYQSATGLTFKPQASARGFAEAAGHE